MTKEETVNGFNDRNIEKTIEIIKENNKKRQNNKIQINELPPFLRKRKKELGLESTQE